MVIKLTLALPLFFCALLSQGQPSALEDANSNHVVIGAFASKGNAERFTSEARSNSPNVKFEINPVRELFYVYVTKTEDRVQAFAEARKLRKESKYWDTWVYYGVLGESHIDTNASVGSDSNGGSLKQSGGKSQQEVEVARKNQAAAEAEVKAYSMSEEPNGLDLNGEIARAKSQQEKNHYEAIKEVKQSATKLDETTKVIVFKDDEEGRKALRSLGYEIEEGKPVSGFFDSKNNILAINATESQSDVPFHEGLKPVVKFLRKKDPAGFDAFASKAATIKHPMKGVTYGVLTETDEEALGNLMADVAQGYFENSAELKSEAVTLMGQILVTLGVAPPELALNNDNLKTTSTNLALAVREATGFDADGNRKFRFNLYNTMNSKPVVGEIDLVSEGGKKLMSYTGNELVNIKRVDASGNIILACDVLGYRKLLVKLNYDNPFLTNGVQRGNEEEAVVPFGLVRLQKGDISVMYNVYFFKDAAIIRPESRYEINNLLGMMNENSKYKIRIHGHANGNRAGKIITVGESKNYFSLSDTKEGRGSAKKLSEERAEAIREFLVGQGIATDRMEVKAWGGKRPLYDKNHSLAQSNVRVEIEILEN